jgi:hypothetical protein
MNFFWGLNHNLIFPWLIFEFCFDSFLSIFPRISMFEHFRGTEHTQNQFFVERFLNFFMFTMVLLDGILDDFSKL